MDRQQSFDQWLRVRTGEPLNEGLWDSVKDIAKTGLDTATAPIKNWAATQRDKLDAQKKHRDYMGSQDRKNLRDNPNKARTQQRVVKAAKTFKTYLGLGGTAAVDDALLNIAAARIHGYPLTVSGVDIKKILNALWMPKGKTQNPATGEMEYGPALADEDNSVAHIDTPDDLMSAYTSWGIDTADPIDRSQPAEKQPGKWSVQPDVVQLQKAIDAQTDANDPNGKYKQYIMRKMQAPEIAMAKGEAEKEAHRSGGKSGGASMGTGTGAASTAADIRSILTNTKKRNGKYFSDTDVANVKRHLANAALGSANMPTDMISQALEVLAKS